MRHRLTFKSTPVEIVEAVEPWMADVRPRFGKVTAERKHRAHLRIAARMVRYHELRRARQNIRRARMRRLWLGLLGLLLVVVGGLYWDHHRLKTQYFANMAERYGLPEGIGPLAATQFEGRERSYRFESRREKLRAVYRVNSQDRMPAGDGMPMQWRLSYDGERLTRISHRDRHGQLPRCGFPRSKIVDFSARGGRSEGMKSIPQSNRKCGERDQPAPLDV